MKRTDKVKFYSMLASVFVVFWILSSMGATALECLSNGGEIAFDAGLDCYMDFSQ